MTRNIDAQKGFLSRLLRSEAGNVLAMTAAATFPLLGMVGGAVDMARMYAVKSRLQAACDAGALAGRRVMGTGQWSDNSYAAQTSANKAFDLNFESGAFGSENSTRSFTESSGTVTGTASAQVPMTIMRLFGRPTKTLSVTCDGMMRIPNTDVMFVLDNSGSMACLISESSCTNNATNRARYDAKINGLKRAVKCFYEALAKQDIDDVTPSECGTTGNPTGGISSQVQLRFGFVNYDHMVNVGKLLPNDYLVNSATYQSREPHYLDTHSWTLGTQSATTPTTSWSPASLPSSYQNTSNYGSFNALGTSGTTTVNSIAYSNKNTSASNTTQCSALNVYAGSQLLTVELTPTVTRTSTPTDNNPPVYSASVQNLSDTETQTNVVKGYRYRWFKQSGTNACYLERANASSNFLQTRSGTSTRPITWTPVTTIDYWIYQPVSLNVSALKNGGSTWNSSVSLPLNEASGSSVTLSGSSSSTTIKTLANTSVSWAGCIEERQTVANTDGNPSDDWLNHPTSPAGAYDMDIDLVPSSDATRWKPALDAAVWARKSGSTDTLSPVNATTSLSHNLSFSNCGVTPSRKLTQYTGSTGAGNMRDYINTMIPNGNTYHDIGLLWGARLMSPTGIFASENATTSGGAQIQRHMIFMTDGDTANTYNNYASYGIEWWDHRQIDPTGLTTAQYETKLEDNNNARAAAICTAIKNKGITLWVISYGSGVTGSTVTRLTACASSPAYFFQASNTASLITQFRNIADKISQLRLTN